MASINENDDLDPLPPNTVCIANYDFVGTGDNDLGFKLGEKLTIIEPSKQMFWYLARNSTGQIGLVPVTFIEKISNVPPLPVKPVHLSKTISLDIPPPLPIKPPSLSPSFVSKSFDHSIPEYLQISDSIPPSIPPPIPVRKQKSSTLPRQQNTSIVISPSTATIKPSYSLDYIDERPPMPLPHDFATPTKKPCPIKVGKYPTIQAFKVQSGWFKPTPDSILCKKANLSSQALMAMSTGVYFFHHKFIPNIQYVGSSLRMFKDLVGLFNNLYEKKEENLNNLEREIRFNSPDEDQWNVTIWRCHPEDLSFLLSKLIVRLRALPPTGINERLEFTSRKHFHLFCEWYTEFRLGNIRE